MKKLMQKIRKFISSPLKGTSGYSLTELSISTSIIAVLAVGGLSVLGKKNDADKIKLTTKNMATIETAIKGFIKTKGYIPCPADPSFLETNRDFGKSEGLNAGSATIYNGALAATSYDSTHKCSNNSLAFETGMVPVRTLGLPDSTAYDGWGRKFTFRSASASGSPIDFSNPAFKGNIAIIDLKGTHKTSITEPPPYNEGAIYVLISHGANGKGVTYGKNSATGPSAANGVEAKNTDHKRPVYIQNDRNKIFDDIVVFGTSSKLGRQKIAETPIRIPDIACQNAQVLAGNANISGTTGFSTYASSYATNSAAIFKAAAILGTLCQNRKNAETVKPDRINGLTLWLDANDASTLYTNSNCSSGPFPGNGVGVGCWKDKSGNGNNSLQAAGTNQPYYMTNAVNGKPTVRFDGSDDYMTTVSFTMTASDSICGVFNSFRSGNEPFFEANTPTGMYLQSINNTFYGSVWDGAANNGLSPQAGLININHIVCYVYDSAGGGVGKTYVDGVSSSSVATNGASAASTGSRWIGAFPGGITWWNGDMSEMMIYSKILANTTTAPELDKIQEYLSEKWGIPLTTSTSTCSGGLVFQKSADDPHGSCKCPTGQSFVPDLSTANACFATPNNTTFGKCMTKSTAPDYNALYASATPASTSPDKAGMILWLDANDCTTVIFDPITASHTTTTVKTWKDKSGQNKNASQDTTAYQPLYVTNVINSKPVVRFDGADDFMTTASFAMGASDSICGVFNSFRTGNEPFFEANTATGMFLQSINNTFFGSVWDGAANNGYSPQAGAINTNHIVCYVYDSSASGVGKTFVDGVSTSSVKSNGATAASTGSRWIGAFPNLPLGSNWWNGDMAEMIIYNKALTTQERTNIEDYLSNKWDIVRYPNHSSSSNPLQAGLKLWLDANDRTTIYKDSGCIVNASAWNNVGCWTDKSGNNNNATNATVANQPVYAPGSVNGLPTIKFFGIYQSTSTRNTWLTTPAFDTGANLTFCSSVMASGTDNSMIFESASLPDFYITNFNGTGGMALWNGSSHRGSTTYSQALNANYIVCYVYNNTGNTAQGYLNGAILTTSTAADLSAAGSLARTIGASGIPIQSFWQGYISEIILYGSVLTGAQRQSIERYLGAKWNITVP